MKEVTITAARRRLGALLDEVSAGEEIVLVRRGRPLTRLVPIRENEKRLPSLEDFRWSIVLRGPALSEALAATRTDERY